MNFYLTIIKLHEINVQKLIQKMYRFCKLLNIIIIEIFYHIMKVFKEEAETKRVIFNIKMELAERLEKAKEDARELGKKLDIDDAVNKTVEKFLKKAEKKIAEMKVKTDSENVKRKPKSEPDPLV